MSRVVPSQVVTLIDKLFPFTATQTDTKQDRKIIHKHDVDRVSAILEMADKISPELIILNADDYSAYSSSLSTIRSAITMWHGSGLTDLKRISGLTELNPVTLLRRCLEKCPDEAIEPSTANLDFISDPHLKDSIRLDISASNQALRNGGWKAATVLAGAAVEALLLWALQKKPRKDVIAAKKYLVANKILERNPGNDLEKWNLNSLIKTAKKINIITSETADQATLAKDFRNLIHPGKSIREKQICDRGTALSAIAAVEHIARNLESKFKP